MSSPARSSASATSVGAQGGGAGSSGATAGFVGDDAASTCHFPRDLVTPQDRKDEALAVLKADLMAALDKEVKSLDRDSWMFAGPRSQIHLISRPGGPQRKQTKQ
uniref:Protein SAMBA n=1 Tax=Anthurium amnicola TaxID=1678845 RepID=A0A1D1Z885_9ARAE